MIYSWLVVSKPIRIKPNINFLVNFKNSTIPLKMTKRVVLIFNDNMLTLYTEGRIYVVQLYIKAISLDLANVNVKSKKYLVGGGESGGQERQNMRKKGEGEQRCVTGHNYFLTKKNISPALSAHPRPQLAHGFSLLRFVTLNNWMPL